MLHIFLLNGRVGFFILRIFFCNFFWILFFCLFCSIIFILVGLTIFFWVFICGLLSPLQLSRPPFLRFSFERKILHSYEFYIATQELAETVNLNIMKVKMSRKQ